VNKTKQAVAALKAVGAFADVEKAADSRKIRAGVGKSRNRRHVMRRGPLVVYSEDHGVTRAFRNLPGVELANVESLNLLQLAPGGHLGRFIVWTRGAFEKLNSIWGSQTRESTQKSGYTLPRPIMLNSDLTRIINSDEIQSKVRPAIKGVRRYTLKRNPLKNLGAMVKLNPYALAARRSELLAQERRTANKQKAVEAARAKKSVPLTKEEQKAAARARTHEPQQRLNYLRIASDEIKTPEKTLKVKVQKPRPAVAAPAALTADQLKKKSESRKAARANKPKHEKKEKKAEVAEVKKLTKGQQVLAQLLKSQAMQKVAKKKSAAAGGGGKGGKDKKKEDGKKEDGKKEDPKKAGGKEAAKAGEKGKEAAKAPAKKGK
jgi:hypothetical protein